MWISSGIHAAYTEAVSIEQWCLCFSIANCTETNDNFVWWCALHSFFFFYLFNGKKKTRNLKIDLIFLQNWHWHKLNDFIMSIDEQKKKKEKKISEMCSSRFSQSSLWVSSAGPGTHKSFTTSSIFSSCQEHLLKNY